MEVVDVRDTVLGQRVLHERHLLRTMTRAFAWCLRATGLYQRGMRNALDVRLRRITLDFSGLPAGFDGYTILHLTDPHIDGLAGITEAVLARLKEASADLAVVTGDYRRRFSGDFQGILPDLDRIVKAMDVRDGIYATLGNHDSAAMIAPFESLGMRMLVNESVRLSRCGEAICVTGLDDVHAYYTDDARAALDAGLDGFKIALVHSPDMAQVAARAGYGLYLAGHTHGGQICLPGGRPITTNLDRHRAYASGRWRCGDMIGYTSCGAGVSMIPVRFNTRGEITLITLRRRPPG